MLYERVTGDNFSPALGNYCFLVLVQRDVNLFLVDFNILSATELILVEIERIELLTSSSVVEIASRTEGKE